MTDQVVASLAPSMAQCFGEQANIAQLVQDPLDAAAQRLLIPAALSILRGMHSKNTRERIDEDKKTNKR